MFDPLTAATLSMDRIVEMCDEMIAAYGDELPKLDKKTLVPTSGKTFPKVDSKVLRESWDKAQADSESDFIASWNVIGPFRSPEKGKISLDFPTPVEAAFQERKDGSIDAKATYASSEPKDGTLTWKKVKAGKRGYVNLDRVVGSVEWACAYAYTEIESVHPRDTVLGIGSDDGVKVWLNGKVVDTREVQRSYSANEDTVSIHLEAGINRVLLKIDNYLSGWGFGVSIPKATY